MTAALLLMTRTKFEQHVLKYQEPLDDATKKESQKKIFMNFQFSNKGGLVMPIIIEWTYKDGTKEIERIPAQVWRLNENKGHQNSLSRIKKSASIKLDPMRETADIDESNNSLAKEQLNKAGSSCLKKNKKKYDIFQMITIRCRKQNKKQRGHSELLINSD